MGYPEEGTTGKAYDGPFAGCVDDHSPLMSGNQYSSRPGPRVFYRGQKRIYVDRNGAKWVVQKVGRVLVFSWGLVEYTYQPKAGELRTATVKDLDLMLRAARGLVDRAPATLQRRRYSTTPAGTLGRDAEVCPKCNSPLHAGAVTCKCGWVLSTEVREHDSLEPLFPDSAPDT